MDVADRGGAWACNKGMSRVENQGPDVERDCQFAIRSQARTCLCRAFCRHAVARVDRGLTD